MPKISNEQKLEAIKGFLAENNIGYKENHESKSCGVVFPLYITPYRICVHIGDDQDFFLAVRGKCWPIFIRDADSKAFILEKVQNTIIRRMQLRQKELLKKNKNAYEKV